MLVPGHALFANAITEAVTAFQFVVCQASGCWCLLKPATIRSAMFLRCVVGSETQVNESGCRDRGN